MFLRGALGAAILAVPLASAVGQSASQHDPPGTTAGDSSGGHRLAWVAAGTTGAALFTSFVRLSERGTGVSADRGITVPGSPVPNHYTDGTLGSGVSPGQNAPLPGQALPPGQNTPPGGDTQQPGVDDPRPITLDAPTDGQSSDQTDPPGGDQTNHQQPPSDPPKSLAVVVTTPEPESIYLLGTGVFALIPVLRRRRAGS